MALQIAVNGLSSELFRLATIPRRSSPGDFCDLLSLEPQRDAETSGIRLLELVDRTTKASRKPDGEDKLLRQPWNFCQDSGWPRMSDELQGKGLPVSTKVNPTASGYSAEAMD